MGLFARLSGGNRIGASPTTTERFGSAASRPISRLVAYRTNFLESWLWQNVSIGRTGSRTVHEVLPDTTTSWYLTGFSIDPVYGLGIIKKPIEFITVKPFYIVDSLPYSIKRGEAAVLQFTLFNNLGAEYIADVTLYNVANQTEFIERPDKGESGLYQSHWLEHFNIYLMSRSQLHQIRERSSKSWRTDLIWCKGPQTRRDGGSH